MDTGTPMLPRFVSVSRLMREFGLPWQHAEAIVREQTAHTRRHPLVVGCVLGGLLIGNAGVPLLVAPERHLLATVLRLGCLAVMVAGWLLVRVLARRAILDAALAEQRRG